MTYSNMAPNETRFTVGIPMIRYWHARTDVPYMELYFKNAKCSNESLLLTTALEKCERRILEKFHKENAWPDTYRKFKYRLYKMAEEDATREILKERQTVDDSTESWLSRILEFVDAFENKSTAMFYIKETSLHNYSKNLVRDYIEPCDNYLEMIKVNKYRIKNADPIPKIPIKKILNQETNIKLKANHFYDLRNKNIVHPKIKIKK